MSKFHKYFLMSVEDIADYVKEKLAFFPDDAQYECKEIGDGNLNYVFRLRDVNTGKSIIIKQAGESLRISEAMKVSTDRGRIEAEILGLQNDYAPDLVPEVYFYDVVMSVMMMQDMVGHTVMRTGLMNHEIYPLFADQISTFLVNTLLLTSDVVMEHKAKKKQVKNFINPQLCEISEDLVYSEPFLNYNNRNNVIPEMTDFVQKELYDDVALHLEAAKCKFAFMNHAQSLVHGDLHTGSIFINKGHTYVFDPEFAFYGPMGYDIGNVIANLIFAWCHGDATIEDNAQKAEFCGWIMECIKDIVNQFNVKFKTLYQERVTDAMAKTNGFMDWYLGTVLEDTAAVVSLEMIRRTVGMANVKDITTISNQTSRVRAEKIVITLAKECMFHRDEMTSGEAYVAKMQDVISRF